MVKNFLVVVTVVNTNELNRNKVIIINIWPDPYIVARSAVQRLHSPTAEHIENTTIEPSMEG